MVTCSSLVPVNDGDMQFLSSSEWWWHAVP